MIFTSGTLLVNGRFDYFIRAIGLTSIDPSSRHIDPVKHGNLTIEITGEEITDEQKAQAISSAERPCLVLTTSHADTIRLGAFIKGAIVRQNGEALTEIRGSTLPAPRCYSCCCRCMVGPRLTGVALEDCSDSESALRSTRRD